MPKNDRTPDLPPNPQEARAAYALLRAGLGVNLLLHGLVRLPHPFRFAEALATQFQAVAIPAPAVKGFALALPFLEGTIGLLLLLGLGTRWALRAGSLLMIALVAGTALLSDWHTLGIQMIYLALYYLLHRDLHRNGWALDRLGEAAAR